MNRNGENLQKVQAMTPERWQQVDGIFQAAIELDSAERAAFLNTSCSGDEELRREVESLITTDEQGLSFIDAPAYEVAAGLLLSETPELNEGQHIGHYQIVSMLGAGGMGEVYLAQDTKLGRQIALKLLPAEFTGNPERLRRFQQEARAVSALNHPNILTLYEINHVEDRHLIATEFVDGETLRQRLKRSRPGLREALDVAIQVAGALAAAHEAGIVHCDIKPENIMFRRDGYVKVLDFGLAKLAEPPSALADGQAPAKVDTTPGLVMGTVKYMSPEQARGLEVDARSDIFSLGVVLYEMIAGRAPFEGATTSDLITAILREEPVLLTAHSPNAPEELQRVLTKSLRKDKRERYQTIQDLLADLKGLKDKLELGSNLHQSTQPGLSRRGVTTGNDLTALRTTDLEAISTASNVEYFITKVKRLKRGMSVALGALVLLSIISVAYFYYPVQRSKTIDSIVVLPFVNEGGDANTEYLSDGISEALINSLTQLQQLRVVARSTAFRYKGREIDARVVGHDLSVKAVLTGRVRQLGETLNVQVDLVDATTGAQLWGGEYERKASDALFVKQEIAWKVMAKLRLKLSGEEQQQLVKRDTTNAEAYQFYLRGRYFWNKRTAETIKKGIDQFQQAIDRDPNYALGYVGLADCYLVLEQYADVPGGENLGKARAAVDRALQIDDSLAEAHTSSAKIYFTLWHWAEAEEEFKRAISLNPNYPTAHHWFSHYLEVRRQFDDAMKEAKRAQELDPLAPVIIASVTTVYLLKNDLDSAIKQSETVIALDPNYPPAHSDLGWAYLKQRRYEEATAQFEKLVQLSGRASEDLGELGYCYAVTGRRTEALAILKELEERYGRRESIGYHLAIVCIGLGDKDQAFTWLEKDFQRRSSLLPAITNWIAFEDLRRDPRYADLVQRMGLKP
jgi:serine/threonine protein kinase/tetratricopeptide (TPR) repeat protein